MFGWGGRGAGWRRPSAFQQQPHMQARSKHTCLPPTPGVTKCEKKLQESSESERPLLACQRNIKPRLSSHIRGCRSEGHKYPECSETRQRTGNQKKTNRAARSKTPPRPSDTRSQGTRRRSASLQQAGLLGPQRAIDRRPKGARPP